MTSTRIQTTSLDLVPQTRAETLAYIAALPPEFRQQVSPIYLEMLEQSAEIDPWVHGFSLVLRATGAVIGKGSFKGPPDAEGMVEIAYTVDADYQGRGYATEAAGALARYAFDSKEVWIVRAHTLPEPNASTRVLAKNGFEKIGEVIDPEDGLVWRWELLPVDGTRSIEGR